MTKAAKASGKQCADPARSQPQETDSHWTRGRKAATRTTWIIAGVAVAFYAATLVLGHWGRLNPSWEPQPTVTKAEVQDTKPPVRDIAVAPPSHAAHP